MRSRRKGGALDGKDVLDRTLQRALQDVSQCSALSLKTGVMISMVLLPDTGRVVRVQAGQAAAEALVQPLHAPLFFVG